MVASKKKASGKGGLRENFEAIGTALLVALLLRFLVIEAFKIPSGSMIDTLEIGDFIFVNKLSYRTETPFGLLGVRFPFGGKTVLRWGEVERGDVVVFRWPNDPDTDYIKRLIGVPGDVIEGRQGQILVNGEPIQRTFVRNVTTWTQNCRAEEGRQFTERLGDREWQVIQRPGSADYRTFGPIQLADGQYFAMGDNRDNSYDSRGWGPVPYENLKGKALFVWLSLDRCAELPGRVRFSRFGHPVR